MRTAPFNARSIALAFTVATNAVLCAQTSAPARAFDAVSIKRNTSGDTRIRFETPPGRLNGVNVPLRFAIQQAYRLPQSRVLGGPAWLDSDRFDIAATASGDAITSDEIRQMLRTALADRFGVAVHNEMKQMPIYSLVLAKSDGTLGPNLRRSSMDCAGRRSQVVSGQVQCGVLVSQAPTSASLRGGGASFAEFVRLFSDFLERPLIDNTGLTGTFDLELQFTATRSALPGAAAPGGLATTSPLATAPSTDDVPPVFTAVQEQLGLKLNATTGTAEVLIIDRAMPPTEN
jgi:uncharacterized protein (TIGR03435 family)